MDHNGILLCSRFAYPPNSFGLCGPDKLNDLKWYASHWNTDEGTKEILTAFTTLYPYLSFIAYENNIKDPFHPKVVESYWIGNTLLKKISFPKMATHLQEKFRLHDKLKIRELNILYEKIPQGALPHHSFHVLNIYIRTGNIDAPHSLQTMEACLINWGRIIRKSAISFTIECKPLVINGHKLAWGNKMARTIETFGQKDILSKEVNIGDSISYHWGKFCTKLNSVQLRNLIYYTNLSIKLANMYL